MKWTRCSGSLTSFMLHPRFPDLPNSAALQCSVANHLLLEVRNSALFCPLFGIVYSSQD